jgi:hypothetical protein
MTDDVVRELLGLVREQQQQNARLIESMASQAAAQTAVFQSWLDMFKPSATPLTATSPDERALARDARELEAWDPLAPIPIETLIHGE